MLLSFSFINFSQKIRKCKLAIIKNFLVNNYFFKFYSLNINFTAILSKQVGKDSQYLQHTFITDAITGDIKSESIENASDDFFHSDKSEDEARETPNHEESSSN